MSRKSGGNTRVVMTGELPQDDPITKQFQEAVRLRSEMTVTVDEEGHKHYLLVVDPTPLGIKMADPDATPRRPTFTELVEELNKKGDT